MYGESFSQMLPGGSEMHPQSIIQAQKGQESKVEIVREVQSEHFSAATIYNSTQNKKSLVKLMLEVRLEQMGFGRREVELFIGKEIGKIVNIDGDQLEGLRQTVFELIGKFLLHHTGLQTKPYRQESLKEMSQQNISFKEVKQRGEHNLNEQSEQSRNGPKEQLPIKTANKVLEQITCQICYSKTIHWILSDCHHNFCQNCMLNHIRQSISEGIFMICCPQFNCSYILPPSTAQNILPQKQFKKYIYFYTKNQKQLNPNNKFCPSPDCQQILIKQQQHLHCNKCQLSFCPICLETAHDGSGCDDILKATLENSFARHKIKKCPGCKSPIEKSDGCNHMTCKKCQQEFCWICLRPCSQYHYQSYNCLGCPNLQFGEEDQLPLKKLKILILYLTLPLILSLILLCYFTSIPIYMLFMFFYKPIEWIGQANKFTQGQIVDTICGCVSEVVRNVLLWFMFQPRCILFTIFVAPVKMTMVFCQEVGRNIS